MTENIVRGDSQDGIAVEARSVNNHALFSRSETGNGVIGHTNGDPAGGNAGVFGEHLRNGTGVTGKSQGGFGVVGVSDRSHGVHGRGPTGGFFEGGSGAGVHAVALATGPAGRFDGDVQVSGDISLTGGDCAEEFDVVETEIVESGTVMVLGEEGELRPSYKAYDKRVAGVISGARDYKPGIVLDKQPSQRKRQPIALLGKVYCKVDAGYAPIEIGDLLTTSPTQGHAMKATDPLKAFGTVIGKALRPVREAQILIPVLVALQ
jgi:hypothetical protein